jgi:hypothetical protein
MEISLEPRSLSNIIAAKHPKRKDLNLGDRQGDNTVNQLAAYRNLVGKTMRRHNVADIKLQICGHFNVNLFARAHIIFGT